MKRRLSVQGRIRRIEANNGRIAKSNFIIADWVVKSTRFSTILKNQGNKRSKVLQSIYNAKHRVVREMLKTGLLTIEIYKPEDNRDNEFQWLYVLSSKAEGIEFFLVVPYQGFRKEIGIDLKELNETTINRDMIFIDGIDFTYQTIDKRFALKFILENIEKCRLKLIEKMEEEK